MTWQGHQYQGVEGLAFNRGIALVERPRWLNVGSMLAMITSAAAALAGAQLCGLRSNDS